MMAQRLFERHRNNPRDQHQVTPRGDVKGEARRSEPFGRNAHILHYSFGAEDARREDGPAGLGGAVGGAEDCEGDGTGAAHGPEERLLPPGEISISVSVVSNRAHGLAESRDRKKGLTNGIDRAGV